MPKTTYTMTALKHPLTVCARAVTPSPLSSNVTPVYLRRAEIGARRMRRVARVREARRDVWARCVARLRLARAADLRILVFDQRGERE